MKRFLQKLQDLLADAALYEGGVDVEAATRKPRPATETFEELFMEIAFAEAGDFDDIRKAILKEHEAACKLAQGGNDLCYV